jgi:hypothetical protein
VNASRAASPEMRRNARRCRSMDGLLAMLTLLDGMWTRTSILHTTAISN